MHQMTTLNWIEAIGWLAAILTVATDAMNTMMSLPILAIASSLCLVVYAGSLQLWPLLAVELLLLPINLYRFGQRMSLRSKLSGATDKALANF